MSGNSSESGIFVSAPGKIILFGEHAVVYGRTAVAGSIDLRTYVSLHTSKDGVIYLSLPSLSVEKTWLLKDLSKAAERVGEPIGDDSVPPSLDIVVPMARKLSGTEDQCGVQELAVLAFWYLLLGVAHRNRDLAAVKVTIKFKLPSCVGLGSSGAYCVCTAAALLMVAGIIPKPTKQTLVDKEDVYFWEDRHLDTVRRWAAQAESLIHGRASGLDAAVCTYGGLASFRPGVKIEHIKNSPDLRVILVNSKVERNTSRMVAQVKDRLRKFPAVVESIFNAIDAISKEAVRVLRNEEPLAPAMTSETEASVGGSSHSSSSADDDHASLQDNQGWFARLNDLARMNNQLLVAIGVGHPKIDSICVNLARYGIHPKMTGAGGGGSVFAFLKPDTSQTVLYMITQEIKGLGFEIWQPMLGGPGVCLHERRPEILVAEEK